MSASMLLMVALVGVLLVVVVALCYRLWKLRQVGGTAAILRDVPAVGGHGWRHGVMRYQGGEAGFYRLSSLRWWPDRRLSRRGLEIVARRPGSRVPALGEWLGYLMRPKTGRVLLLAGWLWLGWHYFSR